MANDSKKIALVTGGAKRVGAGIVRGLRDAGYDVWFTYHRSQADADRLHESSWNERTKSHSIRSIFADLAEPDAFINSIVTQVGPRLDLLVNNASWFPRMPLETLNAASVRKLYAIHVESPLRLVQAFASALRTSHGHIVNMLDLLIERPPPGYAAYAASKAALANLTLSLARELAPDITVNGIAPGVVDWPEDMPQDERDAYLKRVPLGRAGTPEDVAKLVLFLASDAGAYITGQIIRLDGGRSAVG
ncbi:MAG: SDR family oxidoreductase [Tepidisphaeraceae bacterium]